MRSARPLSPKLLIAFVVLVAVIGATTWASTRARHHATAGHVTSPAAPAVPVSTVVPSTKVAAAHHATSSARPVPPIQAGMRAYLDPETGTLGAPAPGQMIPPNSATTDAPTLHEVTLPDGSVMVDLQGTLQDYMILQLDKQGHRVMRCVPNPT